MLGFCPAARAETEPVQAPTLRQSTRVRIEEAERERARAEQARTSIPLCTSILLLQPLHDNACLAMGMAHRGCCSASVTLKPGTHSAVFVCINLCPTVACMPACVHASEPSIGAMPADSAASRV